jgi:AraC-like DNA-binding protein
MRLIEDTHGQDPTVGKYRVARAEPAPRLRPFVREYMGYLDQAAGHIRLRELPIADTVVIINLGASWRMLDPANEQLLSQHDSFAAGVSGEFALVEGTGSAHCFHLNLTPLGGYRFFGMSMRHLSGRAYALRDLLDRQVDVLRERLYETQSWDERFRLLDDFVSLRMERARPVHRDIAWAVSEIERTRGSVRVGELAMQLGCSRKHLRQRFLDQVGTPAKQLAQLLRFNHVVERLQVLRADAPERQLAALALESGYADHAHLTREFHRFSGWTPSEYQRRHSVAGGVILGVP